MTIKVITEQVDFLKSTQIDTTYKANKDAEFTFGDIEGNAMKLLYLLIKYGIATNIRVCWHFMLHRKIGAYVPQLVRGI